MMKGRGVDYGHSRNGQRLAGVKETALGILISSAPKAI